MSQEHTTGTGQKKVGSRGCVEMLKYISHLRIALPACVVGGGVGDGQLVHDRPACRESICASCTHLHPQRGGVLLCSVSHLITQIPRYENANYPYEYRFELYEGLPARGFRLFVSHMSRGLVTRAVGDDLPK